MRLTCFVLSTSALLSAPLAAQVLFGPPVLHPTDAATVAAVAADVNGDGVVDLVSREANAKTFVRLGLGGGAFDAPTPLPWAGFGSPAPVPHALADLNGDGHADLVVDSLDDGALLIFRGDGAGGFDGSRSPAYGSAGVGPTQVVTLDLDGDGSKELIALSKGTSVPNQFAGTAQAYAFGSDFAPHYLFGLVSGEFEGHARAVALGDVDRDGVDDLLLADTSFDGTQTRVLLMYGINGLGFKPPVVAAVLPGLHDMSAFDFDHDGELDLLGRLSSGAPAVQLMRGDGVGGFIPGAVTPLPAGVADSLLADMDGDGVSDLVVSFDASVQPYPAPSALILRGLDDGRFTEALALAPLLGADLAPLLLLGDLDPDGRFDVLLAARTSLAAGPAFASLRNETYPEGGPLLDLGGALPGSLGGPIQLAAGAFTGGAVFAFSLVQAKPGADAFLVAGFSELRAAFKGGVMVPAVDRLLGPLPVLPNGEAGLAGFWPDGVPTGFELFTQFWIADDAGPAGFASSSAVRVTSP